MTVQGWLQILGPATSAHLATLTHLHPRSIHQSMVAMEMQGLAMRGIFEYAKPAEDTPHEIEWCERRILQRIHRLTLGTLRKQVEPVTSAVFMRWLLDWHHIAPATQLTGEEGVLAAIEQLEGFEAPAVEWERTLLPARVADYDPRWLDNLCLAGVIGWVMVLRGETLKLFRCVALEEVTEKQILEVLQPTFSYVEDELSQPADMLTLCGFPAGALSGLRYQQDLLHSRFGSPGAYNAGLLGYLEGARN